MSDVGTDAAPSATADAAPPPEQGGGMRMPRSRGLVSGVLLLLAGVWAAFIPFVGPAFHFSYTPKPHETWHWTAARGWFEVLPGGLAALGGLLLIFSAHRIVTSFGAWIAVLAGGWLVVAQQVYYLLTLGSPGMPSAAGDRRYVAEYLAFFTGIGALIILFGALAAGRLSVRSMRDIRAAARRDEQAALAEQEAVERDARERDAYERATGDREVTDRNAETWADGDRGGNEAPGAAQPLPVAPVPGDAGRSASAVTRDLPVAGHEHDPYREHTAGPDDDTTALPVVPEHREPVAAQPSAPDPGPEPAAEPELTREPEPVAGRSEPAHTGSAESAAPGSEPAHTGSSGQSAAPRPEPEPEPAHTGSDGQSAAPRPEPEPEPEPQRSGAHQPIVLEPPAGHPDAQRLSSPVAAEPSSDTAAAEPPSDTAAAEPTSNTAAAWNPEAQSPTTTGEFPAVGATPSAPAPETPSAADTPRRGVASPRRYFGPNNPAPQDEAATRDPVRTDEADDLDDMDLDEPTR